MIRDYAENIENDFLYCIDFFKRMENREPTLQEFKNIFIEEMKAYPSSIYLKIDLAAGDTEELIEKFSKIVRKNKKNPRIIYYGNIRKKNSFPVGRIRGELKRYLEVYDLRKIGMKYEEIIETIGTKAQKGNGDDPNLQKLFQRDFDNAKKIINNVAKGYFPTNKK